MKTFWLMLYAIYPWIVLPAYFGSLGKNAKESVVPFLHLAAILFIILTLVSSLTLLVQIALQL